MQFTKLPADPSCTIPVEKKKFLKLSMGEQSLESIPTDGRQSGRFLNRTVKVSITNFGIRSDSKERDEKEKEKKHLDPHLQRLG